MALLDMNNLINQVAMTSGLLNEQGQMVPQQQQTMPQGILDSPALGQALLALGANIAQANQMGYGVGGSLAVGAQAFGNVLQAEKDRIEKAQKEATQERLAALKDIIGLKQQQSEMGLRMQAASLQRRAQQDALDERKRQQSAEEQRRAAILASGDPRLIQAYQMFGDGAAQDIFMSAMEPKAPNTQGLPEGYMWGPDGSATRIPGITSGGVKPDALVPGLQVAEGAKPVASDAAAIKTVKQAYTQLKTLLPEYKNLVQEYGSEIEGSGGAMKIEQKQAQIALQVKNLEELGALQEADRQIINDMMVSPVRKDTVPVLGRLNPTRLLDKGRAVAGADDFEQYLTDRYLTALQTRGYVDPNMAKKPDALSGWKVEVVE